MRVRFTIRFLVLAGLLVALFIGAVIAFRGAGRWLVREDPLAPSDAIVVLSGGMPYRAEGAADLYRRKYAPEVWVTTPESPARDLSEMGIQFTGEEEYSREVLIHGGVPAGAIRVLPDEIINTEEEIGEITHEMQNLGKHRIIIVSSPPHTRRVRALWSKMTSLNDTAIIEAATEDPFDAEHWWRNTRDTYAVVREFMGLMNAWSGLAIRPHPTRN